MGTDCVVFDRRCGGSGCVLPQCIIVRNNEAAGERGSRAACTCNSLLNIVWLLWQRQHVIRNTSQVEDTAKDTVFIDGVLITDNEHIRGLFFKVYLMPADILQQLPCINSCQ